MRKTLLAAIAAAVMCVGVLAGCAGSAQGPSSAAGAATSTGSASGAAAGEKIEVVCATFPAYDWVREVVGDQEERYEITYLMGTGVDLHSYEPTVDDIAKIADADLFVYVGGESDGWAEDVVETVAGPDLHVVNMLEAVGAGVVEEEVVEGMQAEDDDHEHAAGDDHGEDGHGHDADLHEDGVEHHHHDGGQAEYDEHVWLSLRNAQVLVSAIADGLSAVDPEGAAAYAENADAYNAKLAELDARYAAAVAAGANDTVVFADRFPFRYLVDDYNLNYYAAFVGCSAETEASFETIAFLAQKVDDLGLSNVLVIENSDRRIAQTVVAATRAKDQAILVMDSLQSASDADVAAGKTYLGTMEDNLSVLTGALA